MLKNDFIAQGGTVLIKKNFVLLLQSLGLLERFVNNSIYHHSHINDYRFSTQDFYDLINLNFIWEFTPEGTGLWTDVAYILEHENVLEF